MLEWNPGMQSHVVCDGAERWPAGQSRHIAPAMLNLPAPQSLHLGPGPGPHVTEVQSNEGSGLHKVEVSGILRNLNRECVSEF